MGSFARRLSRFTVIAAALSARLFLAAPAMAQSQQADAGQPNLVGVMLWTLAIVCIAMLVLFVGYLYRRARGEPDELIPKNVDPYYAVEGREEEHSTGELHPEMAHDDVGYDAAERAHHGADGPPGAAPLTPEVDSEPAEPRASGHGGH